MKHTDNFMNYLSENNFVVDELGRIVIDDPEILLEINDSGEHSNNKCGNGSR